MCVCVDGTANLCCASVNSLRTICRRPEFVGFFAQTQKELGVLVSYVRLRFVENYFTTRLARTVHELFGSYVCTSLKTQHCTTRILKRGTVLTL